MKQLFSGILLTIMITVKNIKHLFLSFTAFLLFAASGNTVLGQPEYNEVHVPSIGSKLYLNTGIMGNPVLMREVKADGSLGPKYDFEVNHLNENWAEITFADPVTRFTKLIVLGSTGNILLNKSKSGEDILLYKNGTSSGDFVIRFGTANETLYFSDFDIEDIESIDVGLTDEKGEKIKGEALVASDRFLVLKFRGISPEFINKGQVRLVMRFRAKSLVVDLDSWGYDFDVLKTENTKKHLTSNVYGLKPHDKIKVYYEVFEGQSVEPTAEVFTVKELNDGKTFAVIEDNNSPIKLDFVMDE